MLPVRPAARSEQPAFRVREARFLRAGPTLTALGPAGGPEVAFLGRSNVGKSSLLGVLLERPKLIRVSREPGRTRDVNLFDVEVLRAESERSEARALTFADLPGYGFAKVSHGERARMGALVSSYLAERKELRAVCQLFDLRHAPSAEDCRVHDGLAGAPFAHLRVATKSDKLAVSKRKSARRDLARALGCDPDELVLFSSEDRSGRELLWERIWERLA